MPTRSLQLRKVWKLVDDFFNGTDGYDSTHKRYEEIVKNIVDGTVTTEEWKELSSRFVIHLPYELLIKLPDEYNPGELNHELAQMIEDAKSGRALPAFDDNDSGGEEEWSDGEGEGFYSTDQDIEMPDYEYTDQDIEMPDYDADGWSHDPACACRRDHWCSCGSSWELGAQRAAQVLLRGLNRAKYANHAHLAQFRYLKAARGDGFGNNKSSLKYEYFASEEDRRARL
ncbi:hypothetical protein N0V90_003812 [Kalmusia sp. IMI 367209]|nr:hypothetical protein N0V90_003812 [Kalmusia sp. IMI 367209]